MGQTVNILLTSAGRRSYLVKYFMEAVHGNGIVHAANSVEESTALKAADQAVITPCIYDGSYIPFLLSYCKKHQITAVIPLFDIDLLILSKHKEDFERIGTKLIVSDYSLIEACNDKWKMKKFLEDNKFDILPTFLCVQDAVEAVDKKQAGFPLIVKPRWGMGSMAVYTAENVTELEVFYEKAKRDILNSYLKYESQMDMKNSVLIQEKAKGQEYGLDVISDLAGNYCNTVVKKKLGMRSGETDCATVVHMPQLEEVGRQVSAAARHIANMDIDVIVSSGKIHIIDMNARFGGGYPFSHAAGVNLPAAIVKWLCGEDAPLSLITPETGITAQKEICMRILKRE